MDNQCFSEGSLAKCFKPCDFFKDQRLADDKYRAAVVNEGVRISETLFSSGINIKTVELGEKKGYSVSKLAEKLVLRKSTLNVSGCSNLTLKHRNLIISELRQQLKEGTQYRIYRLDIKSFFESVDVKSVEQSLEQVSNISTHTKNIINSYLAKFNAFTGRNGLPRGVEVSPVVSEIILSKFDEVVNDCRDVFYYARFVDDILIITSSNEDKKSFLRLIKGYLPTNLFFNYNKIKIQDVPTRKKLKHEVADFDFLGYNFKVVDSEAPKAHTSIFRSVIIDFSSNKVKKIKTKIAKAVYNFSKEKDYDLLVDRLTFLVTNREMKKKGKNKKIPTGIYYSFPMIDINSAKLNELDSFLQNIILSRKSRLGKLVVLTREQQGELMKLSFYHGFKRRVHKRFSPNRLNEIVKIWC